MKKILPISIASIFKYTSHCLSHYRGNVFFTSNIWDQKLLWKYDETRYFVFFPWPNNCIKIFSPTTSRRVTQNAHEDILFLLFCLYPHWNINKCVMCQNDFIQLFSMLGFSISSDSTILKELFVPNGPILIIYNI